MTDSTAAALDKIAELLLEDEQMSNVHFARARRKPQPSYYVVMIDYGKIGREGIVDPELGRADIIELIKRGEYRGAIEFIHHIADGLVEDVTRDLIEAAESELKTEARDRADQIAAQRDHAQDHRKNWVSA